MGASDQPFLIANHNVEYGAGCGVRPGAAFQATSDDETSFLLATGAARKATNPELAIRGISLPAPRLPQLDRDGDGFPGGSLPWMRPKHVGRGRWAVVVGEDIFDERFGSAREAQDWIDAQPATLDETIQDVTS